MSIDYESFLARPSWGAPRTPQEDFPYNFGTVLPGTDILPLQDLAEVAAEVITKEGSCLSYYPPDQGPLEARQFIARNLKQDRGIDVTPDDLLLTNGSNEAIRLVLDNLVNPGDVIVCEKNLYLGSLRNFRQWQARIVDVETDTDGMKMDSLAEVLEGLHREGVRPKFIYTICTYQNPEGTILPPQRRRELLRLAEQHGTLVFEDDCYVHERLEGETPPPAIASLPGAAERVLYCATFSKILGPGVRVGWLKAPRPLLDTLSTHKVSGGNNYLTALICVRYLERYFEQRIAALGATLRERRDAMVQALDEHFGPQATFLVPRGGMFLWVRFPEGVDTGALLDKATEAGVRYNPGIQFSPTNQARNCARMAFAFHDPKTIREGIGVMARVLYREGALPLT